MRYFPAVMQNRDSTTLFFEPFDCPDPAARFPVWNNAAVHGGQADPFCCSPIWQFSFHDAFAPERPLFIRESGESAVAFAETRISEEEIVLTPLEAHWFFGCPLLGPDAMSMFADALEDIARRYAPVMPKFLIGGIRPEGALSRTLFRDFSLRFNFYLYASGVQCAASLQGGVDGFLSRRSANHRAKLRKASRRVRAMELAFERVRPFSAIEADAAYERMLAVERGSWKGLGRCGMAEDHVKDFYALMLRRLAIRGQGRIMFARHEGRDVGFIFGAMAGVVYRGQQFSYDDDWKKHSIGNLLQLEQIIWLCEEGAARYDMGPLNGPRMGYKAHWTELSEPIVALVLKEIGP